jgi:rod shape-determining protein MreC
VTIKLLFIPEPKQGLKLWCLIILSVALMVMDHQYNRLSFAREFLSDAVYPIQWLIDTPVRLTSQVSQYIHTQQHLVEQHRELNEQLFIKEAELQRMLALEAENKEYRSLLNASPKEDEILKAAEILNVDSDPFNHRLVINKGENDGVYIGQPIIDAQGLMGEIIEISRLTSRAILVTDASHAVPVEILRNGVRGIAVGTGAIDNLLLQHVPVTADLKEGDLLVTSGLGGRFKAGYPVGMITEISRTTGESFAAIRVKPSANLDRGRRLLLIQQKTDDGINYSRGSEESHVSKSAEKPIKSKVEEERSE